MKNIELSVIEVKATAALIEKKFNEENNVENLKVNSNPANYLELSNVIKQRTNLGVGNRFLCKYLYESQHSNDEVMVFRKDRVEALYQYFAGQSRTDYLKTHSILPVKVLYIPTLDLAQEKQAEIINAFMDLARSRNINVTEADFENGITTDATQFWSYVNNEYVRLLICVNSALLHDLDGMLRLKELLLRYTSRLVIETNITLLFDTYLFKGNGNINRFEGRNEYFNYWNDELNALIKLESNDIYASEIKELLRIKKANVLDVRDSIFKVLESLVTMYKIRNDVSEIDPKKTVEIIQPMTAEIAGCEIRKLTDVITSLESEDAKDLLCVISYEKYYSDAEFNEMKSYFEMFYSKLRKHRIIRVFCVKGMRNSRGRFSTLLRRSENNNILAFLELIPRKANCMSFLLVYDESPCRIDGIKLLYEQDYIISIPHQKGINYSTEKDIGTMVSSILKNLDIPRSNEEEEIKLFLTYQENARGENQMIELTSLNEIALKKWLEDFAFRVNENVTTSNHKCVAYDDNQMSYIHSILKIQG